MTESPWFLQRENLGSDDELFREFAADISPLQLDAGLFRGDVLVAGYGAFPEQLLICSPESDFSELDSGISSLTCIDPVSSTSLEAFFNVPVTKKILGEQPDLRPGKINKYSVSLQYFLPTLTRPVFDTVLFFRINGLGRQLTDGLLGQLAQIIKPGGHLIGSGSFLSSDAEVSDFFQTQFNLVQLQALSNPDSSDYFYAGQHLGFICCKS